MKCCRCLIQVVKMVTLFRFMESDICDDGRSIFSEVIHENLRLDIKEW